MSLDELAEVNKQLIRIQIIGAAGWVCLGLGVYGLVLDGQAALELLNTLNISIALFVLGVVITGWKSIRVVPLMKKKKLLESNETM